MLRPRPIPNYSAFPEKNNRAHSNVSTASRPLRIERNLHATHIRKTA